MIGLKNTLRFVLVTFGIITLTSITIDATNYLNGSQSALSIMADKWFSGECPSGTTSINSGTNRYCIDQYEVSAGESCPHPKPTSALDSQVNISDPVCLGESVNGQMPWTNVTYEQAKNICAKRGAWLATNEQWYRAIISTPDSECNLTQELGETGMNKLCVSSFGVYDGIGNVWEWVAGEVVDGVYEARQLPASGYVTSVDESGVAVNTDAIPDSLYGQDYFWSKSEGVSNMMRGGFYGSGTDGGVYSVHSDMGQNFSSPAIGFRCVAMID